MNKIDSGIYIRLKKRGKPKDILELTDEEFGQLVLNELSKTSFEGKVVPKILREQVVVQYLLAARRDPEDVNRLRMSLILTLEDLGIRFMKYVPTFEAALQSLGLMKKEESK